MADAAMTVLLETLTHMLRSYSDLISGAEHQLRQLRNELKSFRAFLRDMANKPKEEEPFRKTEGQIAEVVHDAQDTVDSYLIDAAAAQSNINLFPRRRKALVSSLAEELRSLREYKVKPALEKVRTDFPNMLLIGHRSNTFLHRFERADATATVLLENISNLFMVLGGDHISGAEKELRQLKNEVELLTVFLQNTANKPDFPFREMKRELVEFVYDTKHTFHPQLIYAAGAQREVDPLRDMERQINRIIDSAQDMINSYSSKIDLSRRRRTVGSLAEVVRSVREDKVKPMMKKARIDFAKMLLIDDGSETTLEEEPHQIKVNKDWSAGQARSIGIKDEQAAIIGYLKQETEELDFIRIIGKAGLGKTTLAWQTYQSEEIQHKFPTRIWVNVSQDLNRKDVFLHILKEVSSKDMSSMSDDELALAVLHFLEKRIFLLVLDDVWTPEDFNAIRYALPKSNHSSKVLITSRTREVCRDAMLSTEPHMMRFLWEDECWELLQLEVFGGLRICPPELMEIGQHIARKCDGLALTVVLMGGILTDHLSKMQSISALKRAWTEVFENMSMYFPYEIAIEFGYNRLPDELRNLFLYMGVFPEDYEIPSTTLIRLWIAEGFIQHQEGQSLEDIAEEKLNDLIQRKLVIVDKVRSNGKVKSCHLHDTVRDFCIQKGMQLNLFREIRNYRFDLFRTSTVQKKHRRLCIHSDLLEFFSTKRYFPTVRSFSCFCKTESLLLPEDISKIPGETFELLRILDIKHIRFTRFPLELTQLICLRYIVLSSDFKILPEVVSTLTNIQTLLIHTSSRTLEIKADVWNMIQLRHLQTNASIILRKEPDKHSDQELHTLTNLSPDNCTINVLDRAHCLKKLGIRGTLPLLLDGEVGSRKFDHFLKLKELEKLKLLNDVHMSTPSECLLSCLPPPEKFPPKLRSLTLSATFLSWEHMSVLGMLEKLEVLKLKDNAFVGECWEVADDSFPSLQVLQIGYTNLVSWKATHSHYSKLRCLKLRNCEKLDNLPQGLENALRLQEIELLRPTKAVATSARKIEEERRKLEGNFRIKLTIYYPADE